MCSKFEVCYIPVLCIQFKKKSEINLICKTKNKKYNYSLITADHKYCKK